MKTKSLVKSEFFNLIFSQQIGDLIKEDLSTRKRNENTEFPLLYEHKTGIIWCYGIHVLGVLRIYKNTKYLITPFGVDVFDTFKQSRTTKKYDNHMRYYARENNWILKEFFPAFGKSYDAGFSKPVEFLSLTLRESFATKNKSIRLNYKYKTPNELYSAMQNIKHDLDKSCIDFVQVEGEINLPNELDIEETMTINLLSSPIWNSKLSQSLNLKWNAGIFLDKLYK